MPSQFSNHNKGFIYYVFCRNWAFRNPAGTTLDSSLVNKKVDQLSSAASICHQFSSAIISCYQLPSAVFSSPSPYTPFPRNSSELSAISPVVLRELWFPDVEIRWLCLLSSLQYKLAVRNLKSFSTHFILTNLEGIWIDKEHNILRALGKHSPEYMRCSLEARHILYI